MNIINWIEDDGFSCGKSDCKTLDHWYQLRDRMISCNCITEEEAEHISESTWEYYFKLWKSAENSGIWYDEDNRW